MIAAATVSGCFGLSRVDPELEQTPKALARLRGIETRIASGVELVPGGRENPDAIVTATPAVATRVALGLAEWPHGTHQPAR